MLCLTNWCPYIFGVAVTKEIKLMNITKWLDFSGFLHYRGFQVDDDTFNIKNFIYTQNNELSV